MNLNFYAPNVTRSCTKSVINKDVTRNAKEQKRVVVIRKRKMGIVCVLCAMRNVHICARIMCVTTLGKQKTWFGTQTQTKFMSNALRQLREEKSDKQKNAKNKDKRGIYYV